MTVQLPKPVGVFTDGVVEVWGKRVLRVPGQTALLSFYSSSDQTAKLGSEVDELFNSA